MRVQYRGSLKSCNYCCSYCPFAKRKSSERERSEDKKALFRFLESLSLPQKQVEALQIVPYGEAMLHRYYWEFLAKASTLPKLRAVGIQSNLSFSAKDFLQEWEEQGGKREKLRIWATFHPSMAEEREFVETVAQLQQEGIAVSVGMVAVPDEIPKLAAFRTLLPPKVSFWLNAMDKRSRPYYAEEIEQLVALDSNFAWELGHWPSDVSQCQERCFVEADGSLRHCAISRVTLGNWYEDNWQQEAVSKSCGRKECSCFLAYSGRKDFIPKKDLGEFAMFRKEQMD